MRKIPLCDEVPTIQPPACDPLADIFKGDNVTGLNEEVKHILDSMRDSADFIDRDMSDINVSAIDGDNALHSIVRSGDLRAAKLLIEAGIDLNKAGDLGFTPLHIACMQGNFEMAALLVGKGADLFAMSEGDAPFTTARRNGFDRICDFLAPLMELAQSEDPKIRLKARIAQLRREADRLEADLARCQ